MSWIQDCFYQFRTLHTAILHQKHSVHILISNVKPMKSFEAKQETSQTEIPFIEGFCFSVKCAITVNNELHLFGSGGLFGLLLTSQQK